MDADTQGLIMLGFMVLCLWGLLSGGLVGPPQLRRNLRALWARLRGRGASSVAEERTMTTSEPSVSRLFVRLVVEVVYLGLVAWGAVAGGAWGQGFAIFVALYALFAIRDSVARPDPAAKD